MNYEKLTIFLVIIAVFIGTLFGYYLIGSNQDNPDRLDKKYCNLLRQIDKKFMELHPVFYEMEKEVEEYVGGKSITAETTGRLKGYSFSEDGENYNYVCWYEFSVLKGDIIEKVIIQHIFDKSGDIMNNSQSLIEWRRLE